MTFTDVMIDLETLGLRPNVPIVSLGAVQFNVDTGEIGQALYEKIEWVHDQKERPMDRETMAWWLEQDPAAQRELTDRTGRIKLKRTLKLLDDFIPKGARIWANGATFDTVILDDAYQDHAKRMPPWGFRNIRDCRTIRDAAEQTGWSSDNYKRAGQSHNALDDCIFQIRWTSDAWQVLTRKTVEIGFDIKKINVSSETRPLPDHLKKILDDAKSRGTIEAKGK